MNTNAYTENPPVYQPLLNFLITEKYQIVDCCTRYERLGIYDTCSIQYHANSSSANYLASYFLHKFDVLLLTRTVFMELPQCTMAAQKIINYFRLLHQRGIKIVLFDEELVFDCIKEDNTISNKELNKFLCYGILSVKRIPVIKSNMDKEPNKHIKYLPGNAPSTVDFYANFFQWIRSKKTAADGLGECLAMLISYIFCVQPFGSRIIISDDRNMWANIELIRKDVWKHYQREEPRLNTTATILDVMYRDSICRNQNILKEIALCTKAAPTDNFKFNVIFEGGNFPIEHNGQVNDLIHKIVDPNIARILF